MVRVILILFVFCISFLGCIRYTKQGGIRPIVKIFSIKPKESKVIKINSVYKLHSTISVADSLNSVQNNIIRLYDELPHTSHDNYLFLYANGRIQGISISKNMSIQSVSVNSIQNKGTIGYFKDIGSNRILCERFIRGDGGGKYQKSECFIENDTLKSVDRKNNFIYHIYIKEKIPSAFYNLNPDW